MINMEVKSEAMSKEFLVEQIATFLEHGILYDGMVHEKAKITDLNLRKKIAYSLSEHLANNWEQNQRAKAFLLKRITR